MALLPLSVRDETGPLGEDSGPAHVVLELCFSICIFVGEEIGPSGAAFGAPAPNNG